MINSHCYKFKEINYKNGFLDTFVEATYIITMINSSRHKHIEEQLKLSQPTKKLFILYNYGYKNCKKILKENLPSYDITDANFQILYHAKENNFNTILVLEDDFIFNSKIKDKEIINEIKTLFDKNIDNKIFFNLGPMPLLFYPNININNNIYKSIACFTAHANIYNKNIINDIINNNIRDVKHWDLYLNLYYSNYFYKYPLCYQTFPITENQQNWHLDFNNIFLDTICKFIIKLLTNLIKYLKLDIQVQPGYNNMYKIFFIINYFLFSFFILFLLYIIKCFINRSHFL